MTGIQELVPLTQIGGVDSTGYIQLPDRMSINDSSMLQNTWLWNTCYGFYTRQINRYMYNPSSVGWQQW